jgi:hypothetical protein
MTQQIINLGTSANAGNGDNLRSAMDKTNDNFTEVYAAGPVGSNIAITNNTITSTDTNGNVTLATNGAGVIQFTNNVMCLTLTICAGSAVQQMSVPRGIYVGSAGVSYKRSSNFANLCRHRST